MSRPPRLCLVTDRRRLCGPQATPAEARRRLIAQVRAAADAGVDLIQLRERDLEDGALAALTADLLEALGSRDARLVVNDRLDVALACGAAGVHLRGDSIPPDAVRRLVPPGFLVGKSVHNREEAAAAAPAVDYLIAGALFATVSKPVGHPVLGVEPFAAIAGSVTVPVLAIGGVTVERFAEVASAGAAGVAGIGLFFGDVRRVVRTWFDTAGSAS